MRYLIILFICFNVQMIFAQKVQNVLVIHSYHAGFGWTDEIQKGLEEQFEKEGVRVNWSQEYLDSKRYDLENLEEWYVDYFKVKYINETPDIVVVSDNNALDFINKYGGRLFPKVPIVFCGINNYKPELASNLGRFAGVAEEIDVKSLIQLIGDLYTSEDTLFVVKDFSTTSQQMWKQLKSTLTGISRPVKVIDYYNSDQLKSELVSIKSSGVVLLLAFILKEDSFEKTFEQTSAFVNENTSLPIYSFWDFYVGNGATGGYTISSRSQGVLAAHLAIQILRGEEPKGLVLKNGDMRYYFDYKELSKRGVDYNLLPEETVFINKPIGFYEEYKRAILSVSVVFVFMSLIVFYLSVNIVRRKKAEKALIEFNNDLENKVKDRTMQLELANEDMRSFAHIISHDLKSPLRGLSQLMKWIHENEKEHIKKESESYFQMVNEQTQKLTNLIDGVLKYSQLEQDDQEIQLINVDEEIKSMFKVLNVGRNVELLVPTYLPQIRANLYQIQQIFQNLLSNALKYVDPESGKIIISFKETDKFWIYTIKDNGVGIDAKDQMKIFRIFSTLKTNQKEGTGIGLAIVKKLVERNGGSIQVYSELGNGAEFVFSIRK